MSNEQAKNSKACWLKLRPKINIIHDHLNENNKKNLRKELVSFTN